MTSHRIHIKTHWRNTQSCNWARYLVWIWWKVLCHCKEGTHSATQVIYIYIYIYIGPVIDLTYTYLLTPWCRVHLEQLTGLQLVKKFPAISRKPKVHYRHLSLSWASPIQSIYPHSSSWRSILILSTHLCLGLPSGLVPSGFPTKTLYTPSPHPYAPHKTFNR